MKIKLDDGAFVPVRAHKEDAGLDIRAKCEDVVPYNRNEGAGLCIWEGRDLYTKHPLPLLTGTFGWIHLSHVFTARDEDVRFEFRITEATGTMWLDEILLEAVE